MINVYLWAQASHESHNRFNESLATLAVVLVTAANGDIGANHEMPTPQCLVEISSSNLTVKRHTIIVTKVVCPAVLPPFVVAKSQPDAIDEESTCSWINSFIVSPIGILDLDFPKYIYVTRNYAYERVAREWARRWV
ncbi:hypothetical protein YC2023_093624 [Brassica napus]